MTDKQTTITIAFASGGLISGNRIISVTPHLDWVVSPGGCMHRSGRKFKILLPSSFVDEDVDIAEIDGWMHGRTHRRTLDQFYKSSQER